MLTLADINRALDRLGSDAFVPRTRRRIVPRPRLVVVHAAPRAPARLEAPVRRPPRLLTWAGDEGRPHGARRAG
jgi:hypothetical protein